MFELRDQAAARHAALLALTALFDADLVDSVDKLDRPPSVDAAQTAATVPARRRFLRAFMP